MWIISVNIWQGFFLWNKYSENWACCVLLRRTVHNGTSEDSCPPRAYSILPVQGAWYLRIRHSTFLLQELTLIGLIPWLSRPVTCCCTNDLHILESNYSDTTATASTHDQWCHRPLPYLSVKELLEHTSGVNTHGQLLHHLRLNKRCLSNFTLSEFAIKRPLTYKDLSRIFCVTRTKVSCYRYVGNFTR
jgi:hypothetical protein